MRTLPDGDSDPEQSRRAVQEFVDQDASETSETAPQVTVNVTTGEPAEALIAASRDADMLVLGSRGNGGFTRLLLGSVSSQVVHHAACPVVVIPRTRWIPPLVGQEGGGLRQLARPAPRVGPVQPIRPVT